MMVLVLLPFSLLSYLCWSYQKTPADVHKPSLLFPTTLVRPCCRCVPYFLALFSKLLQLLLSTLGAGSTPHRLTALSFCGQVSMYTSSISSFSSVPFGVFPKKKNESLKRRILQHLFQEVFGLSPFPVSPLILHMCCKATLRLHPPPFLPESLLMRLPSLLLRLWCLIHIAETTTVNYFSCRDTGTQAESVVRVQHEDRLHNIVQIVTMCLNWAWVWESRHEPLHGGSCDQQGHATKLDQHGERTT